MIDVDVFYNYVREKGISFFTGVPDSLLKDICLYINIKNADAGHIIAANEGNAVGLAIGTYLKTGKIPMVYMQNSGLGNSINPLISLADKNVYSIPMVLLIGWRGVPGEPDEPQHFKQGSITPDVLNIMDIPYEVLQRDTDNEVAMRKFDRVVQSATDRSSPAAILVHKNAFNAFSGEENTSPILPMSRLEALKVVVECLGDKDVVVSSTGVMSRELYECRIQRGECFRDFMTVGGMGHASQIACGIALSCSGRNVICLDGDGAALMHLGGLATIGKIKPSNLKHVIFNNAVHDSVGGQSISNPDLNFPALATVLGYNRTFSASTSVDISKYLATMLEQDSLDLLEIKVRKGYDKDLIRPKESFEELKSRFLSFLNE